MNAKQIFDPKETKARLLKLLNDGIQAIESMDMQDISCRLLYGYTDYTFDGMNKKVPDGTSTLLVDFRGGVHQSPAMELRAIPLTTIEGLTVQWTPNGPIPVEPQDVPDVKPPSDTSEEQPTPQKVITEEEINGTEMWLHGNYRPCTDEWRIVKELIQALRVCKGFPNPHIRIPTLDEFSARRRARGE